jgi:sulfide:quinone oxidoreductase
MCRGAAKAMYLSADHWKRSGVLDNVEIEFCSAGAVLFGVPDYVPALMEYVAAYGIDLNFGNTLTSVNGPARTATFNCVNPDGSAHVVTREFDMLHVVPPQIAPDFIPDQPFADAAGWIDVDPATLRHKTGPTFTRWATRPTPATPRPPLPPASRRQWSPITCWRQWVRRTAAPSTTATAPAR